LQYAGAILALLGELRSRVISDESALSEHLIDQREGLA
jgi:hypothetical protein